jgi:cytohesin
VYYGIVEIFVIAFFMFNMASSALHKAVKRNDVTMCKTLIETGESVGMINAKGETPLHIAAIRKTTSEIVHLLLEAGSHVNVRNRWGQTPLHHAAFGQNLETLQQLFAVKGLNINETDVSGYTPLHALVYASENASRNFRKCLEEFIASGADVNAHTKFGHSILHLACNKFNNIEILRYLLSAVPGIRCDQTNANQENFLHSFVIRGLDEDANELFRDFIENRVPACNSQMFMQLLNQQDIYGQTPFYMCLDSQELSMSTIKMLLDNGADVNICDNLGNSILHRIVALSLRNCSDVVNLLCTAGADPNAANDHKQSVISFVDNPEVLNVLLRAKADPNKVDNSGRNALAYAAKCKDETLINLLVTNENIDRRDFSGNTALHFASYHNNTKACQDLLQAGADANITNLEGYTALDLAIYHGNIDSIHCLIGYKHTVPVDIYQRIQSARNVLHDLPDAIKADELNALSNIINAPSDANLFLQSLLTANGIGKVIEVREANDIQQQVQNFVETLCKKVSCYDARFTMSVFPTGSSAEGTKVGRPDEFDFVLCLEKIAR